MVMRLVSVGSRRRAVGMDMPRLDLRILGKMEAEMKVERIYA